MSTSNIFLRDQVFRADTSSHVYLLLCPMFQRAKKNMFAGEDSLLNEEEKILCYRHCDFA